MRSALSVMIAGAVLSGAVFVGEAEAGNKHKHKRSAVHRVDVRYDHRGDRYFRDRDVVVIRDHYRPYYQPLPPGLRKRYYRTGSLPPGWSKRMRPVPVYVERELIGVPRG